MAIGTANTKVFFKKGTQSNFNSLNSFTEGSFYLTDAGHLYYANGTTKGNVILISNVHTVTPTGAQTRLQALNAANPIIGDYYYVTNENILLYKTADGWNQINADTTLDPSSSVISVAANDETTPTGVVVSATVSDTNNNSATGNFSLIGGTNISVTFNGNIITIDNELLNTNTTYSLSSANTTTPDLVQIKLSGSDSTSSTVSLKGNGGVSITRTNDQIVITGENTIDAINLGFDGNGILKTELKDGTTVIDSATALPVIQYGTGNATTTATFANGTAALSVYSTTEVDALIENAKSALNAMTYKGTISTSASFIALTNSTTNNRGDTYKVSGDIDISSPFAFDAKIGDLIIFNGADGASATTSAVWEKVPSGDETLLQIDTTTATNTITFKDKMIETAGQDTLAAFTFNNSNPAGKNYAPINISTTANSATAYTINFYHNNSTTGAEQTIASATNGTTLNEVGSIEIPGISSLYLDDNGHVTNVTVQKYKIYNTHATISALNADQSVTTANNSARTTATLILGYQLDESTNSASQQISIVSDTLKLNTNVSGANGAFAVDLEWGTFGT